MLGVALGVPSLVVAVTAASLWHAAGGTHATHALAPSSHVSSAAFDFARGAVWFGHLVSGAAAVLFAMLAVAACASLAFAILAFVVGDAIGSHRRWGRVAGIAIAASTAFATVADYALVAGTSHPLGPPLAIALLFAGCSSYALWVLLLRFR